MALTKVGGAATAQLLVKDFWLGEEKVKTAFVLPNGASSAGVKGDRQPSPLTSVLHSSVTTSADGLTLTITGDVTGTYAAGEAVFVANVTDGDWPDRDDEPRIIDSVTFSTNTTIVLRSAVKAALRNLSNAKVRKSNYTNSWDTAANDGHGDGGIGVQGITDASGNPSSSSQNDGRFQAMAIGKDTNSDTRTAAEKDTGLGAEFTTGGATRRTGADIKTYLVDDTANSDATKRGWWACWKTTWTLTEDRTGSEAISEFIVSNGRAAHKGFALMRQTFAEGLEGKNGDKFTLVMIWKGIPAAGSRVEGDSSAVRNVLSYEGLREVCRLLMSPKTTRHGEAPSDDPMDHDGVGGGKVDWLTDYTVNTVANWKPRPFDAVVIGNDNGTNKPTTGEDRSGGTAAGTAVNRTNTKLGREITSLGGARKEGATNSAKFTGVRGSLMQAPTDEPFDCMNEADAFGADTSNVFLGDTVQWATAFKFSGTVDVDEYAVTQGTTASQGVHLCRITNGPNTLDFDDKSRHTPIIRLQVVIPTF